MSRYGRVRAVVVSVIAVIATVTTTTASLRAQDQQEMSTPMPARSGWMFMQDGIVFGTFNHQGGPRGGTDFTVPNWWMGMLSRETSHGRLTFNGMFSLDPATVGEMGYRQLFQAGEAV